MNCTPQNDPFLVEEGKAVKWMGSLQQQLLTIYIPHYKMERVNSFYNCPVTLAKSESPLSGVPGFTVSSPFTKTNLLAGIQGGGAELAMKGKVLFTFFIF